MLKLRSAFARNRSSTKQVDVQPDHCTSDRHRDDSSSPTQPQPRPLVVESRLRRTLVEKASFASLRERRAGRQAKKEKMANNNNNSPPQSAAIAVPSAASSPRQSSSGRNSKTTTPSSRPSPTASFANSSSSSSSFNPPPSPQMSEPPSNGSSSGSRDQPAAAASSPTVKRNPHHHQARVHKRVTTIGPYRLGKTLGQGSMGKVKLATHAITGEKRACKIIPRPATAAPLTRTITIGPTKSINLLPLPASVATRPKAGKDEDDSKEARIVREIAIMLLLNHPHIALMHEVILQDDNYYLFLEHVDGGQMLDYMINHGKLKEKNARRFLRQIISAIDYCHQNSIVHRDLKIENVLIDKNGAIKLIDFGLSNMYAPSSQLETFCGSLYFAAPELLSAKAYTGPEVDIWSLGVILYVLVCGRVPFDDVSMPVLHAKIKAGVVEYPSHLSEDCKHLISRLLVTAPHRRATMAELKQHAWVVEGYDGPPQNYMPHREPLTMPLDIEAVNRIRGFDFGEDEFVAQELEAYIASEEDRRRSTDCPLEPRASVYHLVREKMFREQAHDRAFGISAALSENAFEATNSSSSSVGSAHLTHVNRPTRPRAHSEATDRPSADPQLVVPQLPSNPKRPQGRREGGGSSTLSLGRMMRRISSTFSRTLISSSPDDSAIVTDSYHVPEAVRLPEPSGEQDQRPSRPSASTAAPSVHSRASTSSMYSTTSTVHSQSPVQGRADANIQTLSLKHLLSTTTTAYQPTQIRHILIRVLESFPVRALGFVEVDGGFSCEFLTDDAPPSPPTAAVLPNFDNNDDAMPANLPPPPPPPSQTSSPASGASPRASVHIEDGSHANHVRAAVTSFPASVQLPKAPKANLGASGWARKIRKRSSSIWSLASSSSAASTATTATGGQDAVRFDIQIVKIPVVGGVHGVKFSRVSGDPWKYKSICSTIIERANF
ncbi:serine/threonine-protein kinase KIN2 [Geranomyces variabilis]|uniref:non-specific serine/threonine protein kinase n=1 Tax=Geranomyces variabilis TaxID=109894 RepID=A0AAD5TGY2_9FUNG|nr:serine/threonine-protein kinase KIN2 [Geranomyces variabilis]